MEIRNKYTAVSQTIFAEEKLRVASIRRKERGLTEDIFLRVICSSQTGLEISHVSYLGVAWSVGR